jgi:hypothetical protein
MLFVSVVRNIVYFSFKLENLITPLRKFLNNADGKQVCASGEANDRSFEMWRLVIASHCTVAKT